MALPTPRFRNLAHRTGRVLSVSCFKCLVCDLCSVASGDSHRNPQLCEDPICSGFCISQVCLRPSSPRPPLTGADSRQLPQYQGSLSSKSRLSTRPYESYCLQGTGPGLPPPHARGDPEGKGRLAGWAPHCSWPSRNITPGQPPAPKGRWKTRHLL